MGTLIPIVSLLVVVAIGLLVTRIGGVALMFTGLSRELAHFQALSAFLGVGFTTSESEQVIGHPVRRRIIRWLMLLGNAGFVATVSSLIPVFFSAGEGTAGTAGFLSRILWLVGGLALLWTVSASKWVDGQLSRATAWALKRWTQLDVQDYQGLLQLGTGYTVSELKVEPGHWVAGKSLLEVRLGDEGVQVLGIRRADGDFVGAPSGRTYFRKGDVIIVYGRDEHLSELDHRRADASGDEAHASCVWELNKAREEQEQTERGGAHGPSAASPGENS